MGDAAADAGFIAGGLCCICCSESLEQWCLFNTSWGSGSGNGRQAGCCTRCCKRSFDEDEFAAEQDRLQRPREDRLKREQVASNGQASSEGQPQQNSADTVHEQPEAKKSMEVPRPEAAEQPKLEQAS